ncbi:MAG: hypothetical protein HYX82_02795 [Chloroflexi bacterium]|nr:hypothetical protein [Chloroflexota bacterium]
MYSQVGILNRPSLAWTGKALLIGLILLALEACVPGTTPTSGANLTPTPSPALSSNKDLAGPPQDKTGPEVTPEPGSGTPGGQAGTQEGEPHEVRPIIEQTYQWAGVVEVNTLEGRHLELKRECDSWVLLVLPIRSDDVARKLEQNVGNRVVVWGKVSTNPSIYMRQAIAVQSVFGPNDPMPMLDIPEYPCASEPVSFSVTLISEDVAVQGELVWEGGKPYLSTPAGRIALTIASQRRITPGETIPQEETTALPSSPMDVVAVGQWRLEASGLTLSARIVRPWPVSLVTRDGCGGSVSLDKLQRGELVAMGTLVTDAGSTMLKTAGGPIQLSFAVSSLTPTLSSPPVGGEAVVIGQWKLTGGQLRLMVRWLEYLNWPCQPPPTPTPKPNLLPGEIAAVGNLVWEGGQPYLDTPSGRIVLLVPVDVTLPAQEPSTSADPDVRPTPVGLQVLAVGKWSLMSGQLVIAVRYLRHWLAPGFLEPTAVIPEPTGGQGAIYGRVSIGPLCPVEPCPSPQPDVYSSRKLILQPEVGQPTHVKLNPDGSFKATVDIGVYTVSLTNCSFLGCKNALPKKVDIASNQATLLEIDIDTGIR